MISLLKKVFFKFVGMNPYLDRLVRYRNPRRYWQERGGETYYGEQEAAGHREERSKFIAEKLSSVDYRSLLEAGCGYGKQLQKLKRTPATRIAGIDFSRPQLVKALEVLKGNEPLLAEADAEAIPFKDKSFDLVMSSAVILHNHHEKAQKILSEMIRVSRRYLAHNEDTDITFSRYGYDMKKTYEKLNFKIVYSSQIQNSPEPEKTQFTIVEIPEGFSRIMPEEIPLQYYKESR